MASQESFQNKNWNLSLYELHREPHELITDNTEIVINQRTLHSELMCPICLDMLKNTMTTKQCHHRFCADCIVTALRSGNKECPTCRMKCVSKRSLRPDPNFDSLIEKIFPSRVEYEAHQENVFSKIKENHSQTALVNSINEGIKYQSQHRPHRARKHYDDTSNIENVPKREQQNNSNLNSLNSYEYEDTNRDVSVSTSSSRAGSMGESTTRFKSPNNESGEVKYTCYGTKIKRQRPQKYQSDHSEDSENSDNDNKTDGDDESLNSDYRKHMRIQNEENNVYIKQHRSTEMASGNSVIQ